jgi:hypothetical protein
MELTWIEVMGLLGRELENAVDFLPMIALTDTAGRRK